ncbi:MAG: UDP-N-acetylmuramoyl-L-alanine--D-glutamate ligase, partial [Oscillospiraceae bacterium]|nr:UDP-N-acetylmuramoyl-L-alanine--D-glutamate ligase [Oscillospiraceae bacterium]
MTKLIEKLSNLTDNKKVLILGFGMEGQSTYKLLKEINPQLRITVADINPPQDFADNDVVFIKNYNDCLNDFDIVFKSPGIVLDKNPKEYSSVFTSQTELFLELYRNQVIGITGTKGKSTVATLLYHVLSENNVPCILAGNIGIPVFDIIRDIKEDTTIVYELSCHQLEYSEYSPST